MSLTCLIGCTSPHTGQRQDNNLALQQLPRAHLTYVAIGASDTFGTGTDNPRTESWPAGLAHLLVQDEQSKGSKQGQDSIHLINLGIPGMHVHDALNVELPVALDAHPDLVTIWLAVNDLVDRVSTSTYEHDLDLLLQRLQKQLPHTHIVVANVPDLTLLPRFSGTDTTTLAHSISSYNAVIQSVVDHHHVLLVDLSQAWQELPQHLDYISSDGFHPSTQGYKRLARLFYQALKQHRIV
ncbi:SGNH/GDSL hydrolase family protein [Ktedonospora formicarum]|uniref:SGNH/GDSL hydrolase family protein n=1 Tax=Ktedonospora formicarum TaxID=2778364 RepID=UPI001C68AB81|nr:GDSL-type esterase/lipase family protein [Ktedonospora formicarum]